MLACWSFGLFGLSQFLRVFRSVFLPQPFFIGCGRVLFATLQLHHRAFSIPSKSRHSLHSVALHFVYSGTCPARKKNYTSRQKLRQPCRKRLPPAAFHFVTRHLLAAPSLHSRTARASPLHKQKITSLRYANFLLVPFRLKAALPALFFASPTHNPRPPTPKDS